MRKRPLKIEAPELRLDVEKFLEPFSWDEAFGTDGRVEIEVGIGKGRFLLAAADARPDVLHLGVEWANKYLRMAETRAVRLGLKNVRFLRADAKELVHRAIPSDSVSAYYVFYPDPWPKKRHQKRRFLRRETVDHLSRTLKDGGPLHVATDHADYWAALEPVLDSHPDFERRPEFGGEDFPVPADVPLTNFEVKYGLEGRDRFRGSWHRRPRTAGDAGLRLKNGDDTLRDGLGRPDTGE